MGRYLLVADRYGDVWAADVLEVVQTASPDAVQITYRLPNGEEHRGYFRPAAIKEDRPMPRRGHPSERAVCSACGEPATFIEVEGDLAYCTEHRPYRMGERFEDDMSLTLVDEDDPDN